MDFDFSQFTFLPRNKHSTLDYERFINKMFFQKMPSVPDPLIEENQCANQVYEDREPFQETPGIEQPDLIGTLKSIPAQPVRSPKKQFPVPFSDMEKSVPVSTLPSENAFFCDQCTKSFTRKEFLNKHIKTHLRIKKFVCEICHTRFTRSDNMNAHMRGQHNVTIMSKRTHP